MTITLNGSTGITSPAVDVTTPITVADGGTGSTSLTANNVLLGNGTSAVQAVAPGTSGNVLTSDGTTWASTAPAAGYAGPSSQAFTSSGTFTVPTGITRLKVTVIGGGGGGGGAWEFSCAIGAGMTGGSGGASIAYITGVTGGQTISVTIGAGGTAGVNSTTNSNSTAGGAGGTTSFGAYVSATGGGGGGYNGPSGFGTKSLGGVGSGGTFNYTGMAGGYINAPIRVSAAAGGAYTYTGNGEYIFSVAGANTILPYYVTSTNNRSYFVGTIAPLYFGGYPAYIQYTYPNSWVRTIGTSYGSGGCSDSTGSGVAPLAGTSGFCLVEW